LSAGPSVGIVGGGVMGLSLARSLARRGHEVTLRSAVELGAGGASEAPAALLNPYRGRTGRPHPDDLLALAVVVRWDAELRAEGLDPGVAWSGVLRIADGARQARAFAAVPGLAPFPPGAAPTPYRAPHGGALAAGAGWLDPRRWCAALAASARSAGADLRAHAAVAAVGVEADGRWRLEGPDGTTTRHDRLVLATGATPWPTAWGAQLARPDFDRHAGEVAVTELTAPPLPLAGGVYLAPAATATGLRAAIGGHHRPPGPPAADAARRLADALVWAWPPLAALAADGALASRLWWGVRAHANGNRPQLLEVGAGAWWAGALAGRGFLAAAQVAEAAASRLRG